MTHDLATADILSCFKEIGSASIKVYAAVLKSTSHNNIPNHFGSYYFKIHSSLQTHSICQQSKLSRADKCYLNKGKKAKENFPSYTVPVNPPLLQM